MAQQKYSKTHLKRFAVNKRDGIHCDFFFTFFFHSRGVCFVSSGVGTEDGENWCYQINRLQQLLDKLECQVHCEEVSSL